MLGLVLLAPLLLLCARDAVTKDAVHIGINLTSLCSLIRFVFALQTRGRNKYPVAHVSCFNEKSHNESYLGTTDSVIRDMFVWLGCFSTQVLCKELIQTKESL